MKTNRYYSLFFVLFCWCGGLLPATICGAGTMATAATITGYTLVNADTDQDLFNLTPGQVIDMGTLPTLNVNIRANVTADPTDSVIFVLTGPQSRTEVQRVIPYSLFSDLQGDYFAWAPPLGTYILVATPYGPGTVGLPLTINFTIINSIGTVASLTLVNADNNQDIQPLVPGTQLDLASLPTKNLNIRANINSVVVGSVAFDLNGPQSRFAVENVRPYALFSDSAGRYVPWTPVNGNYSLMVVPYSGPEASGGVGVATTISFAIINSDALPVQLTDFTAQVQGTAVQLRWNTASEEKNHAFEIQRSLDGRSFSTISSVAGHGTTATPHAYSYVDQQMPLSPAKLYYRLRQVDTDGRFGFSPIRIVVPSKGTRVALQVFSPLTSVAAVQYVFSGPTCCSGSLELYNLLGQRLGRYPLATDGVGTVPVAGLPTGGYVLHLTNADGRFTSRFILP